MNKGDNSYVLLWAKKIMAIRMLGGKCFRCGTTDEVVLEFHHHLQNKEISVSRGKNKRWSVLSEEVKKCKLVCSNCHSIIHVKACPGDDRRFLMKKKMLEYKGVLACQACGFSDDRYASLNFHHRSKEEKSEDINVVSWRHKSFVYKPDLVDEVRTELDKCDILCRNCHQRSHVDIAKLVAMMPEILSRVDSHRELKRVDRGKILDMYRGGIRQTDIAKGIGCSKAIVSMVVNNKV